MPFVKIHGKRYSIENGNLSFGCLLKKKDILIAQIFSETDFIVMAREGANNMLTS